MMSVISNLLITVVKLLDIGLSLYMWIVIARAVVSWVNADPYNPIVRFLYSVTEPLLSAVRRNLPVSYGGFDFSPVVVILSIVFLRAFLIQTLLQLAARLV
jgi:YggT family protein